VLHRQVKTGWSFTTSTNADQNNVRQRQIPIELPIIVRQTVVDGLDSVVILFALADVRETPYSMVGLDAKLLLQRIDKGAEHVKQHAFAPLFDDPKNLHIYQSRENNGFLTLNLSSVVDLTNRLMGFVHGINEGQAHMPWLEFKLGQNGISKGLSRDASAVGYKKYTSMGHGLLS
jgi:hypothetical protein